MHLEILLEEPSMENVLSDLLPRLLGEQTNHTWRMHPYMGKTNLLKQLPKLLRGYRQWIAHTYGSDHRIIVIVDQDHDDCTELKERILGWAQEAGLIETTTVRIAIAMLEAWFLGDALALETAFPRLRARRIGSKAKYRKPSERPNPAEDLDNEMKAAGYDSGYLKLAHSAQISPHLNLEEGYNRSHSFQVTLALFQKLLSG